MLWVALHFPLLPPGTLATIAAWACQFTPKVSLEPPQALLMEVQGSLRLFGGEENLLLTLNQGFAELAVDPGVAKAPTARAALWLARSGETHLEHVPLETMCGEEPLAFLQ